VGGDDPNKKKNQQGGEIKHIHLMKGKPGFDDHRKAK